MVGRLEFGMVMGRSQVRRQAEAADSPDLEGFRIVVLGNFSGQAMPVGAQHQFKLLERIDIDRFDAVLTRLTSGMRLALPGATGCVIDVPLSSMEDFEPDALFLQQPLFARLRQLRSRLADSATFEAAAAEMRLADASCTALPAVEDDRATLSRLLGSSSGGLLPAATLSASESPNRLDRLLRGILAPYIHPNTAHLQQALLDALDRAVSDLMRQVLRHPSWREVEAAWRCVDNFLRTVDAPGVTLELLDVRAAELTAALDAAQGDLLSAELTRLLDLRSHSEGLSARPAVVVGLYEFGSGNAELTLLAALATVCSDLGAVLLASAAPDLIAPKLAALPSQALSGPTSPDPHSGWQGLRSRAIARQVALFYPRVLGRLPYGPRDQPVASFAFDELGDGHALDRLAWRSAALDAAALLAQAHAEEGRYFDPEQRRALGDFPAFVDRSQVETKLQACAEVFWSERELAVIGGQGIIPLISDARLPRIRLGHWRSIAADGAPLQGCWCI